MRFASLSLPFLSLVLAGCSNFAASLADLSTGTALTTTVAGGAVPQSEINTLADMLATCVGAMNASDCSALFESATADGTASGAQPTDTATEFPNAGAPISPSNGYRSPAGIPVNIALDDSGNLWVAGASESVNTGASSYSLFEFIGVSAPVVTPIAAGVKNKTLSSRP